MSHAHPGGGGGDGLLPADRLQQRSVPCAEMSRARRIGFALIPGRRWRLVGWSVFETRLGTLLIVVLRPGQRRRDGVRIGSFLAENVVGNEAGVLAVGQRRRVSAAHQLVDRRVFVAVAGGFRARRRQRAAERRPVGHSFVVFDVAVDELLVR